MKIYRVSYSYREKAMIVEEIHGKATSKLFRWEEDEGHRKRQIKLADLPFADSVTHEYIPHHGVGYGYTEQEAKEELIEFINSRIVLAEKNLALAYRRIGLLEELE